jgi:hypothetical protein
MKPVVEFLVSFWLQPQAGVSMLCAAVLRRGTQEQMPWVLIPPAPPAAQQGRDEQVWCLLHWNWNRHWHWN